MGLCTAMISYRLHDSSLVVAVELDHLVFGRVWCYSVLERPVSVSLATIDVQGQNRHAGDYFPGSSLPKMHEGSLS